MSQPPSDKQNTQPGFNALTRRHFLGGAIGALALGAGLVSFPGVSLARATTDNRLVVVILRGGMDGLAAVPPVGDRNLGNLRGEMALRPDDVYPLDGFFGLHPAFAPIYDIVEQDDFLAIHAVASPYRKRSHFDAQNVLEIGGAKPHSLKSGWLNRLAAAIDGQNDDLTLAVGTSKPLLVKGAQPVGSWAPSSLPEPKETFYQFAEKMYQSDPALAKNLKGAMSLDRQVDRLFHDQKDQKMARQMARKSRRPQGFPVMAESAGKFLTDPDGPRLATLELGGWDTHINQGSVQGQLAGNLGLFAQGLSALKQSMQPVWDKTVIVAITEFGRTARPNGSKGTDHGTAGAAFLLGGAVNGGRRVVANWPGLREQDLYMGRDLMPSVDIRAVMKGILKDHYGLSNATLNYDIYPDSQTVQAMRGLLT